MQLETPPTPEWIAKNAGNKLRSAQVRSTGKEVIDCHMLAYRCPYDVLDEMDVLTHDYRHTVDMLFRAREHFAGRMIKGAEGFGLDDGMELRRLWVVMLRETPKRDADYLAWLGSDIEGDIAAMRRGFYQTAARTEDLLQKASKIVLDFIGGGYNIKLV